MRADKPSAKRVEVLRHLVLEPLIRSGDTGAVTMPGYDRGVANHEGSIRLSVHYTPLCIVERCVFIGHYTFHRVGAGGLLTAGTDKPCNEGVYRPHRLVRPDCLLQASTMPNAVKSPARRNPFKEIGSRLQLFESFD